MMESALVGEDSKTDLEFVLNPPTRYNYDELDLSPQSEVAPSQPPSVYPPSMATMLNLIPFPVKTDPQCYRQDIYRDMYNNSPVYETKPDLYNNYSKNQLYSPIEYRPEGYPYRSELFQMDPYRPDFSRDIVFKTELNPILPDSTDMYRQQQDTYKDQQDIQMQYNGSTAFHQMYQN
jgi:hypothetical protein